MYVSAIEHYGPHPPTAPPHTPLPNHQRCISYYGFLPARLKIIFRVPLDHSCRDPRTLQQGSKQILVYPKFGSPNSLQYAPLASRAQKVDNGHDFWWVRENTQTKKMNLRSSGVYWVDHPSWNVSNKRGSFISKSPKCLDVPEIPSCFITLHQTSDIPFKPLKM